MPRTCTQFLFIRPSPHCSDLWAILIVSPSLGSGDSLCRDVIHGKFSWLITTSCWPLSRCCYAGGGRSEQSTWTAADCDAVNWPTTWRTQADVHWQIPKVIHEQFHSQHRYRLISPPASTRSQLDSTNPAALIAPSRNPFRYCSTVSFLCDPQRITINSKIEFVFVWMEVNCLLLFSFWILLIYS